MKHKETKHEAPAPAAEQPQPEIVEAPAEVKDPVQELTSQLQRIQAEFDNYRRRIAAETMSATERGKIDVIKELLPAIDALELAIVHSKTPEGKNALSQGVTTIHNQLKQILERLGVQEIPQTGLIDPRHHEVYLTETTDKHPANSVIQTLQKGYIRNGTILRTAKVKAARAN